MTRPAARAERDRGARHAIEEAMRTSHGRALAVLTGRLRDFDLAEDALQDAWLDATRTWDDGRVPDNPTAWLVATATRRAIDRMRRAGRSDRLVERLATELSSAADSTPSGTLVAAEGDAVDDERLTLIFMCCHPALAPEARVAITLRSVAGLTTREIARAFGTSEATMQQRIVRTKQRIVTAAIPYRVPEPAEVAARLASVHAVIYSVFTEGYAAAEHTEYLRVDLTDEAIRLAELVDRLMPDQPETLGLRALMLFHDARRAARLDDDGALVLLEDQDRNRWDRQRIVEAEALLDRAMASRSPGPYQLQAAIAALHATAPTADDTDWTQIAALYRALVARWPSTGARLAGAVAIGMADGPDLGLRALDALADDFSADHRWHAAMGHFHERAGRSADASEHFDRAAELAPHPLEAERLRGRARSA